MVLGNFTVLQMSLSFCISRKKGCFGGLSQGLSQAFDNVLQLAASGRHHKHHNGSLWSACWVIVLYTTIASVWTQERHGGREEGSKVMRIEVRIQDLHRELDVATEAPAALVWRWMETGGRVAVVCWVAAYLRCKLWVREDSLPQRKRWKVMQEATLLEQRNVGNSLFACWGHHAAVSS